MPLKNGAYFAGFLIERFLGAGAMGEVYLARHPRLPRHDALKVLSATLTGNANFRRRFEREADIAATLWHQHIVGVHDRGEFDGQLWISMDYVEGTDAGRLLSESFPRGMAVRDVFDVVDAVADALDFAHQRQMLHRDVKPSNILLTAAKSSRRRILLADFGVARRADEVTGPTGTNMSVGSVGYAAPEQLKGERLDGRADQYALAATAFHLLTARMPFQHSNPAVVLGKQLAAAVPRLSESRSDLAHLDRVLAIALANDPRHRYPHCLDFAAALRGENARSVTTGSNAVKPTASPESTSSKPDDTRAIKLRPDAAADSNQTRAMDLRPGAGAAPDPTRAMKLPSAGDIAPDKTRAVRLPPTPEYQGDFDRTRAMKLPPSTAAPRPPRADAAQPSGAPASTPVERRAAARARPPGSGTPAPHPPTGGPPAPRPASRSAAWAQRKAIWIPVAVLVLIATVIAVSVVYWKVAATDKHSRHRNVHRSSEAVEIVMRAESSAMVWVILGEPRPDSGTPQPLGASPRAGPATSILLAECA